VGGEAARYLDTSERPWRWKPEARLSGLTPESAVFLEMATAIGGAFFGDAGLGATMELAALAEKGEATMLLGGAGAPIRATGAAERLVWPGPIRGRSRSRLPRGRRRRRGSRSPGHGASSACSTRTPVRARDDGARMLLDIRSDTGRLFLEMRFDEAANPVSASRLLTGLACPPVL
jgi:hypothetical protein